MKKISFVLFLLLPSFTSAQTSTLSSDPQAVLLANQAQLAVIGGAPVSDVLLNANAQWVVGGTHASGTATLKAKGITESRFDFSANAAGRSELRNDSSGPDGRWAGPDGVRHPIVLHNCWGPAAWFAPHAVVQTMFATDVVLRYIGQETHTGVSVDHVQLHRTNMHANPQLASDLEKLSTVEIFLDASTHLPVAVGFNTHPDNDYGRDIPIEIRFSDYRKVSGVAVPFRIQRFMQGTLNLDLTVSTATINSGLTDSEFAL